MLLPDRLNECIIQRGGDLTDNTLLPIMEHLGIQAEVEDEESGELENTEFYQDVFEDFYDYITNAFYGQYSGEGHTQHDWDVLPFPDGTPDEMKKKASDRIEAEIQAFLPNCLMYFDAWSDPVFRLWKSLKRDTVRQWIERERNEREFISQYGRTALRQLNSFVSTEGLENMYDLSTAHLPESEPDFGDLRFEQYQYGFVVWVCDEDFLEDVPQWLYAIMEQAIYNECLLIKFDADAPVVHHFDTYQWEI